jgi:hypothetical protein
LKTKAVSKEELDSLIDPLTVITNGFELLRHRFGSTMDSYAVDEFERIERSLKKLSEEIERLRDDSNSKHL